MRANELKKHVNSIGFEMEQAISRLKTDDEFLVNYIKQSSQVFIGLVQDSKKAGDEAIRSAVNLTSDFAIDIDTPGYKKAYIDIKLRLLHYSLDHEDLNGEERERILDSIIEFGVVA